MIIREIFRTFGKTSGVMTRIVKASNGQMIPYSVWKAAEDARVAQLEASKRMAASEGGTYDLSQRIPASTKPSYDFTF